MSIGEALTTARRQADLTVSQVSQRTGIPEKVVTDIEGGDYSACGGDYYARRHIRTIAGAVGADPEPLITEYDTARLGPRARPDDVTEPVTPVRVRKRHRLGWTGALALVLVVAGGLGFAAYHFRAGLRDTGAALTARAHPVARHHPSHSPVPKTSTAAAPAPKASATAAPARVLKPASVAAFGSSGAGGGDNSDLAPLAIDGNPATAWHSDWYATASFGDLYPGTGLLVDMGRPVTVETVKITLGSAHGARLQVRVGARPALQNLRTAARAAGVGGTVSLHLTTPARGRYVLIWFTSLPPDTAGTFQVSVHNVRLTGRS
ncbi:MAG TPA: helix-turn-helix domain-containing protein [Streptosporangiaceae bacterium]|nr:helix-turn-helix domain-containing protein [Streptosporangiaceae bacterium]